MGAPTPGRVPLIIPAVLISASAASILSTDLYTPSLPHLPAYFDTDAESVQLTLSLNLLGFALAQLLYGPLSDRFGRRPVLLAGMLAFVLCSLGCALAQSVEALIVARTLQGITAATEAVVALAVIRDLYDDESGVRVLGAYGMTVALAPAVGPIIGGYVHVWQGWRANFILLAVVAAVVVALVWRFLPETTTPDRAAMRPRRLLDDYWALFRTRRYLVTALVLGATLGALFGLLAFGHGFFALWRSAGQYATLASAAEADEGQLQTLEDKLRRNVRVSMWLAVISLILMAGARYIGPVFG